MPLLSTGGVELLVPVARAGCEYSSHLLFDVGNVLVSSSVTTYQCPAMTNLPLHLGAQGHDELSVVRTGSVQVCRVGDEELLRGNGERARFRSQRPLLHRRVDAGRQNRDRIVAVEHDLEGAELLGEIPQGERLDLPKPEFGTVGIG